MAMTQKQFSKEVVERLNAEYEWGLTVRDIEDVFDTISSVVEDNLRSKKNDGVVVVRGLGRVRLKSVPKKKARMGRNPATGEEIKIGPKPATKKLVMTFDKSLREALVPKKK